MTDRARVIDIDDLLRQTRPDLPSRHAPLSGDERQLLAEIIAGSGAGCRAGQVADSENPLGHAWWLAAAVGLLAVLVPVLCVLGWRRRSLRVVAG